MPRISSCRTRGVWGCAPPTRTLTAGLRNDCEAASETDRALPLEVDDGTFVGERFCADCAAAAVVSLITIEHGGHTGPGSLPLSGLSLGRTSSKLDASFAPWDFFEERRPAPWLAGLRATGRALLCHSISPTGCSVAQVWRRTDRPLGRALP